MQNDTPVGRMQSAVFVVHHKRGGLHPSYEAATIKDYRGAITHPALPFAERAVAGALRVLGPEHPNTKIFVGWRDRIQAAVAKPD